jgi:AcrR family transcriptional regulator
MAARGPRGAGSDTRGEILAAAERLFSAGSFDTVSVRAIAREAGVDPALVRHYFGSKADLFVGAMRPMPSNDPRIAALLNSDRDRIGRAFLAMFLDLWDDPVRGSRMRAVLVSALTSPEIAASMRGVLMGEVLLQITGEEPGPGAERASAAATQAIGIAIARHVLGLPGIQTMERERVLDLFAPTFQHYLTGELPER